jgi:CDGSH-type Zn-finger protein
LKIIPKHGQWFRLHNSHGDAVFLAGEIVRMPSTSFNPKGRYLQVKLCKCGYSPISTHIPLCNNSFDIITDPEEEAMLCLAYLGIFA